AFLTYGGMAITASAPAVRAWRARSTDWRVVTPETPTTTGTRRATVAAMISATRLRSSSDNSGASLALTGATTPCAPASTQKRTQRSSDCSSTSSRASNGVTGIVKTPRHWVAMVANQPLTPPRTLSNRVVYRAAVDRRLG